jgi:hypothetical protein
MVPIGVNLSRKATRELIPWGRAKFLLHRTNEFFIQSYEEEFSFEAGVLTPAGFEALRKLAITLFIRLLNAIALNLLAEVLLLD